jgi:arsenate reductase (glutaredoxin)
MQTLCSRCQVAMHCGAKEKTCWCTTLPDLPPSSLALDASCLCAACLETQLHSGIVLYGIANCDTVKKARAWLSTNGIDYAFWDFKKHGVPETKLMHWLTHLGWERVLNTRGTTWRGLDDALKARVVDAPSAQKMLVNHASAIKRPIVCWGNTYDHVITVGFDAALWQQTLKI